MSAITSLNQKKPAQHTLTFERGIGKGDDPASMIYALCALTRTLEDIQFNHYQPSEKTQTSSDHAGLASAAAILAEQLAVRLLAD